MEKDDRRNVWPLSAFCVKEYRPYEAYEAYLHEMAKSLKIRHQGLDENSKQTLDTEVMKGNHLWRKDERFKSAIRKEVIGLEGSSTQDIIQGKEPPPSASVKGGRFVYAIENYNSAEEVYKIGFVRQGHTDKDKDFFLLCSTTVHQYSIGLLVSPEPTLGFRIWSHDAIQEYLQSNEASTHDIYPRRVR